MSGAYSPTGTSQLQGSTFPTGSSFYVSFPIFFFQLCALASVFLSLTKTASGREDPLGLML